jgi:hypothetical protein
MKLLLLKRRSLKRTRQSTRNTILLLAVMQLIGDLPLHDLCVWEETVGSIPYTCGWISSVKNTRTLIGVVGVNGVGGLLTA